MPRASRLRAECCGAEEIHLGRSADRFTSTAGGLDTAQPRTADGYARHGDTLWGLRTNALPGAGLARPTEGVAPSRPRDTPRAAERCPRALLRIDCCDQGAHLEQ